MEDYSKRIAHTLRGQFNDLKRRPEDVARELSYPLEKINDYISGRDKPSEEFYQLFTDFYPVNRRDLHIIKDDCPEGVKIMRAEESAATSRVMNRAGKPYYEYRDTAMSSVGQFRPEWIKELCVVDNNDPENPDVQWNNGHFMHQFTYFIGPVNFYYKGEDGKKNVAVMNTGDSMYITPFVPHTFTTRKNDTGESGLILALTYGNKLAGDTQQELSALGVDLASEYAFDFSSREKYFASMLSFHREAASVGVKELAHRSGLAKEIIENFENGKVVPEIAVLQSLAKSLSINVRDLLPFDSKENKVIVQNYADNKRWFYPENQKSYEIVELSVTKDLPHSKSFEFNLQANNSFELDLKCGLHQYGYNTGDKTVQINWRSGGKDYSATVSPGDSFYVKPFIHHNFRGENGKLLVLRIGGRVAGEPLRELSLIGKDSAYRAIAETMPWFNKEGRSKI